MPFKSEAQRKFVFAKHPGIAKRWTKEYGSGKNPPEHVKGQVTMDAIKRARKKRSNK